ncbi:MAG: 3'-5' exonuclease [Methanoregula sp.]|jgi:DNA polymerase III epsilon subunit-like protein|nr:3'-5' exonuclease [Methanoregula sp.]
MILFLDLETNGLAKSLNAPIEDIDNWARIVQIAWAIFEEDGHIIKKENFIIFPIDFTISETSSLIHGITTKRAEQEGVLISKVLQKFNEDLEKCRLVVAHNIAFDIPTLNAEFKRNKIQTTLLEKEKFCTMKSPEIIDHCGIPHPRGSGYKWPTLSELHQKLFDKPFEDVHNASADVDACARCYFELKKLGLIKQNNESSEYQ